MSLDDAVLRAYIDEVFQVYDTSKNGTLDTRELHNFFNQLYASLNQSRRFNQTQITQIIYNIDLQRDGEITKPELFTLFKLVWQNPGETPLQASYQKASLQYGQPGGQQYAQQYNPNYIQNNPYGQYAPNPYANYPPGYNPNYPPNNQYNNNYPK